MRPQVHVQDLGQAAYKPTWDLQERLLKEAVDRKIARRRAGLSESNRNPLDNPSDHPWPEHHLLFVEHPHVLTLGKSGDANHVVASPERLEALGVEYHEINRGGDITYHGPGQLVAYPILDLDQFRTDIGWYLRQLEEAVIRTCADWGVPSGRVDGLTGVWIDPEAGQAARKICAIGVKCSRWVTMHGLAFNLNTDLDFFNLIVPCGIQDRGVTTLAAEANRKVARSEARDALESHLLDVLGADSFAPRP
jgi:lipoyl(octanoyl) transferase